jgi:glyoxylase I family protein
MLQLNAIHHVAIICSDYQKSKHFYTHVLGLKILSENYREQRKSWKLDLAIGDIYMIELFSFPDPPVRVSQPEARGLRHVAFEVANMETSIAWLNQNGVSTEQVRTDEFTGKRFTFFQDPDALPLELYEK